MTHKTGIYKISNLQTGDIYIGSATNIEKRWYQHLYHLRKSIHHCQHLQRAWNKYGESAFEFAIIEICEIGHSTLLEKEQHYLDTLKPKYNVAKFAGRPMLGRKLTAEQKAVIGARSKGKKYLLGHHHTEESKKMIGDASRGNKNRLGLVTPEDTKIKMSISMIGKNLGKKRSPEDCAKMSMLQTGKRKGIKFSNDHKSKISSALKGRTMSDEWRKKLSESAKARHKRERGEQ